MEGLELGLGEIAQAARAPPLLAPWPVAARVSPTSAARHQLDRAVIELAQQRRLPAVPHLGAHGADIGDGEDEQQLQPLGRLHLRGEAADGLGIVDVELEGGAAHQQMPAHEPGDRLGLLGAEAEARTELLRHLLAQHRMVAAAALGDVVQQHGEIERAARIDRRHQRGRERQLVLQARRSRSCAGCRWRRWCARRRCRHGTCRTASARRRGRNRARSGRTRRPRSCAAASSRDPCARSGSP